ncbi:MAG: phosphotriesterase family protein [Bacteroidota bacterium]
MNKQQHIHTMPAIRRILLISLPVMILIMAGTGCNQENSRIMTVTGPIQANEMGVTLEHEHIMVDFIGADSTGYHRWDRNEVVSAVLPHFSEVKKKGLNTLVECTPAYLGRDPRLLKTISQKTNIQILTNTGYYGAVNEKFLPQHTYEETADQLAERWINEWENGIEDTDIKPGFIKISVAPDSTLSDVHEKLARAAAKTHLKTGLTIASHTGPAGPAFAQLKVLKEEGVAPEAFIWVHAQNSKPAAHVKAAKQGAWVSLDGVKQEEEAINNYVNMLSNLKERNLLHRVLISHDAGWYSPGETKGGDFRPYTAIFDHLIPALKKNGFSEKEVDRLLKVNPQNAFSINTKSLK